MFNPDLLGGGFSAKFIDVELSGDLTVLGDFNFGDAVTDTILVQGTQIIDTDSTEAFLVRKDGDVGDIFVIDTIGGDVGIGVTPLTNMASGDLVLQGGSLVLKEITTPTADAGYGKIYTTSDNELFFQDGGGANHLLHGDAFSNLWFHSTSISTIGIGTAAQFNLITSFENIGAQDDLGNVVANTTNNDFTIGSAAAGKYKITFHTSIGSETATSEMIIAIGITLATPIDVTGASNTTPITVTSNGHGLMNGDMVTVNNDATGNTGIRGDWIVTSKTDNTFIALDLVGGDSVGNGAYDASSGNITIKYPGNILIHRDVGFGSLGTGGANADTNLAVSDKIKLYVANVDATRDLFIAIVNMEIFRIGD